MWNVYLVNLYKVGSYFFKRLYLSVNIPSLFPGYCSVEHMYKVRYLVSSVWCVSEGIRCIIFASNATKNQAK